MNAIPTTECRCQNPSSKRFTIFAAGALILIAAGMSTSCATTKGFGKDVEKAGDKIQEAASR